MVVGCARKGFWFGPIGVSYVFVTVCRTLLLGGVSCGSGVGKMDGGSCYGVYFPIPINLIWD